ncbi:MAG: hypothetical protein AAFY88_30355, partial [Acidobacteriota bacterium]
SSDRAGIHSLWKVDLEGGEPEWLAGGGNKIKHPAHARQAEVLAYEEWQYEINLWRFDLEAGATAEPEPLVRSTAWDLHPSFSPDGQHLAFTSTRSGSHELWMARADGAEPSQLTQLNSGYVGQGAWSPDGASIVFPANRDGQTDLYRLDLGDLAPVQLTNDVHQEIAPNWSRDGEAIYFSVDRGQGYQVRRLDGDRLRHAPQNGEPAGEVLAQGTAAVEGPLGKRVYFSRLDDEHLWSLPLVSEAGVVSFEGQASSTGIDVGFGRRHSWQADVNGITFLDRSGRHSVLMHWPWPSPDDPGPVVPSPVLTGAVPGFGRPELTVSPDGRFWVYFSRLDDEHLWSLPLVSEAGVVSFEGQASSTGIDVGF